MTTTPTKKWYALRTYSGHETKVKELLEAEVRLRKLQEVVGDVVIPLEKIIEVKNGKKETKMKNFLPGYIILEAALDKKIIDVILNVPSVLSFVGSRTVPVPLQPDEVKRIIGKVDTATSEGKMAESFIVGEAVKIVDGPFNNFSGFVTEVTSEKQKVKVEVSIFGRKTPVELDFTQIRHEVE